MHVRGTRLQTIEFAYLVVGHTHDLLDAMFAYMSKALMGKSFLSLPEMMATLERSMTRPPIWKHLRDLYGLKESQPRELSSGRVRGISGPNHVRLFWSQDGRNVIVQSKHWLTSPHWSEPLVLLDAAQVAEVALIWPRLVQPEWEESFKSSALAWLEKLRALLREAGKPCDGLDHCRRVLQHEEMLYLPTGQSLSDRIGSILRHGLANQTRANPVPFTVLSEGLRAAMGAAFPGSSGNVKPGTTGLLQIGGAKSGADGGFCQDELDAGMLALIRNAVKKGPHSAEILPFLLGKVLRLDQENPSLPCAFVERWLPIPKDKYKQANLFGKWRADDDEGGKRKASPKAFAVNLDQFLVWPISLETKPGSEAGKVPFSALHFLRDAGHIDVSAKKWAFSKRGNAFYLQAAKRAAQHLRDAEE